MHSNKGEVHLLDFRRNKILRLESRLHEKFMALKPSEGAVIFFMDSTVFFGDLLRDRLDSLQLSHADFVPTGLNVFKAPTRSRLSWIRPVYVWILPVLLGLAQAYWIYTSIKRKGRQGRRDANFSATLDKVELHVLNKILADSLNGGACSIDTVNRLLGVVDKSFEVQKKHRSDVIISINRKYRYVSGTNDLLIKKKRLEQDKRSFEYFVDYRTALELKSQMGNAARATWTPNR
jgi:hypothetical protein